MTRPIKAPSPRAVGAASRANDAPKPLTATQRSRARNARAARILPPITLDAELTAKLDVILARTGETTAAWVRRMIAEQSR